jgi:uncharacterized repeat protein (TIGR03803 family)
LHLRALIFLLAGAAFLAACSSNGGPYTPSSAALSGAGRSSSLHRSEASGYATLYSFRSGSDGAGPLGDVVAMNGALFGTTQYGGGACADYLGGCGTVFELRSASEESVVYAFHGQTNGDGALPLAGLVRFDGALYGTTSAGGRPSQSGCDCGTVFRVQPGGSEEVIHSFSSGTGDGMIPAAPLIEASGKLYGTTVLGGTGSSATGSVFEVNASGRERVIYSFLGGANESKSIDGGYPDAGLTKVSGTVYGTTSAGGGTGCILGFDQNGCGTIFALAPTHAESQLYRFRGKGETGGKRGAYPQSTLIFLDGKLYGTTSGGGVRGSICNGTGCGTIFSIDPSGGGYRILHKFSGGADGSNPFAGLIEVNGTLYGTTTTGGDHNDGTIFSIGSSGRRYEVLHSFQGHAAGDGSTPESALVQVNGVLYGTTSMGGTSGNCSTNGCGTVFKINP